MKTRFFEYLLLSAVTGAALFAMFFHPAAHATVISIGTDPLGDILKAASDLLLMLVGIPASIASILTLLEYFNLITPATADVIQMYMNTTLYIACFLAVVFGKSELVLIIDHYLGQVNHILLALIALLTGGYSMIATAHGQKLLRGLAPVKAMANYRYM